MNNYIISEELVKSLLTYLGSRPYSEVEHGIMALRLLPKCEQCSKKVEEKKEGINE